MTISVWEAATRINDPLQLAEAFWPVVRFYREQRQIIRSIRDAHETFVVAGNQLGKDFVAGYIALTFFLRPWIYFPWDYVESIEALKKPTNPHPHTVRVVSTSVKDKHLDVLWGELNRFIQTSRFPLRAEDGGALVVNHRHIRKIVTQGTNTICPISYLIGQVSERGEGMAGHHAAYNLLIVDEASGVDEEAYSQGIRWAKRVLVFGNPNPPLSGDRHFFKAGVKGGDVLATERHV